MKKFFFTVFFLGGVSTIAFVPVFTKVFLPDMLEPGPPVIGTSLEHRDFPSSERSVVAVKLELPVRALTEKANQSIPREFKGVKRRNFHEKITNGVINWKMWPGKASIGNTGRDLSFVLPIKGGAQATGSYGLGPFSIPVKGNSEMSGSVKGRLTPLIGSDWQVTIPALNPLVSVDEARISVAGREIPDARAKIRECLAPVIRSESTRVGPLLTRALHLKTGVKKLWNQAHVTRELRAEPYTWVVFDPGKVQMSPIEYSNSSMFSLTVGLVAESFVTNAEPCDREPEALPDLLLKPTHPVTDIRVPVIVNYRTLNHTLADRTFTVKTRLGPTISISAAAVEPGQPGYLNLGMNVSVSGGKIEEGLTSRVHVHAKPKVDCDNQVLGFTEVSLSLESEEPVTEALGWLMEEVLVKVVEKELRVDLNEYLPKLEKEIQKVITSVPVPDNFELRFEQPVVKLVDAYTVAQNSPEEVCTPGVVFVMGAKGKIAVKINKL